MGRETWTYNQSTEVNLMKETFGALQDKQFNKKNPILGRAKKKDDFDGEFHSFPVEQSIGGGVSAGSLGRSSRNKNLRAQLRRKKLYGTVAIDRETMKVARGGASAFVEMTSYAVKKLTESFSRNIERQLTLNDLVGTGLLATADAVTGSGTEADPYVLELPDTTVMEQFEEGDVVHLNTDSTDATACEIVEVDVDPNTISVIGTPAVAPAAGDEVYMQFSRGEELPGLQGVLKATTGTYKNIAIGRRWKATQEDASGAAISTALINKVISQLEKTCGESPSFLLASYEQYTALLDLHEDQKRYNMPAKGLNNSKVNISYSGIEVMVGSGAIPVLRSRFVPASEIYVLNDMKMHLKCAPGGFEWFDEDGTVFLRDAVEDKYNARYGGYADFYVNPHFQAIIFGLSVA
jgi:hypothetical protein